MKRANPLEISGAPTKKRVSSSQEAFAHPQRLAQTEVEEKYGVLIQEKLSEIFGYPEFRSKQREIITSILSGNDTQVLMPTGAGKSMCFIMPALVLPGVTLVISPLIALMVPTNNLLDLPIQQDQVHGLKSKKIVAEFIHSEMKETDRKKVYADLALKSPTIKLLYVTPELVATSAFHNTLSSLYKRNVLSCFAIDEAHCISKWGVGFRPKYRELCVLKRSFSDVPMIALTATATKTVQRDILDSLGLIRPNIFVASFNRANIYYEVRYKDLYKNLDEDICSFIEKIPTGSGIIYCHKKQDCDDLASSLKKKGLSVAAYHAGLSPKIRAETLTRWTKDEIRIVIATIAFGMGIDKKDVRFVIHYTMSKSIEEFYQESGRAGRDGLQAYSLLYYAESDKSLFTFLLNQKNEKVSDQANEHRIKVNSETFAEMVKYCLKPSCRRSKLLEYFGEKGVSCGKTCDYCVDPEAIRAKLVELRKPASSITLQPFRSAGSLLGSTGEIHVTGSTGVSRFTNRERKKEKSFKEFEPVVNAPEFQVGEDNESFFASFKKEEARGLSKGSFFSKKFTTTKNNPFCAPRPAAPSAPKKNSQETPKVQTTLTNFTPTQRLLPIKTTENTKSVTPKVTIPKTPQKAEVEKKEGGILREKSAKNASAVVVPTKPTPRPSIETKRDIFDAFFR